jgi:hypothetical protein
MKTNKFWNWFGMLIICFGFLLTLGISYLIDNVSISDLYRELKI